MNMDHFKEKVLDKKELDTLCTDKRTQLDTCLCFMFLKNIMMMMR